MEGFDSPIDGQDSDTLHRLEFSKEIAMLAISAPKRWPIRIGIYGSWGTGKSSAIHLCREIVTSENHLTVYFNPWGHTDATEMLVALASSTLSALKQAGIQVDGEKAREARTVKNSVVEGIDAVAGAADSIAKGSKLAGKMTSLLNPLVEKFLPKVADDFLAIDKALDDRRLVVFVDDVDRVDPTVLPELLFALHEVMAQPGISYVVALDPVVVTAALTNHHPGFASGISFLEKVIQFPRWIPDPSESNLSELAVRDAQEFASFIPVEVILARRRLFSKNPRALRTAIRNLWGYRAQVARHKPEELDLDLLLVVHLLKCDYSALSRDLLRDPEKIYSLSRSVRTDHGNKKEDLKKAQRAAIEDYVLPLVQEEKQESAVELVLTLVNGSLFWSSERIRYHAQLVESPRAVTVKEFEDFLSGVLENSISESLLGWAKVHCKARSISQRAVLEDLLRQTVVRYTHQNDLAADSHSEQVQKECLDRAEFAIKIIETLLLDPEVPCSLTVENFGIVRKAFHSWAHFTRDAKLRELEQELMVRLAKGAREPEKVLETLAPWSPGRDENDVRFSKGMVDVLVPIVASRLQDVFQTVSGIEGAVSSREPARLWVLSDPAAFWTEERLALLSNLVSHKPSEVVADNCHRFLCKIADPSGEYDSWSFDRERATVLMGNAKLVELLWQGATGVAVNPRFLGSFEKLKAIAEQVGKVNLPLPGWWSRIESQLRRSQGRGGAA